LAILMRQRSAPSPLAWTGVLGAIVPFAFGVVLAGDPTYAEQWPLLFGYIGLLSAALIVVALLRDQPALLLGAGLATAVTMPVWALTGLSREHLWGPTLSVIGLTIVLNLPARLALRLAPQALREFRPWFETSALAAWAGLFCYGLILIQTDRD